MTTLFNLPFAEWIDSIIALRLSLVKAAFTLHCDYQRLVNIVRISQLQTHLMSFARFTRSVVIELVSMNFIFAILPLFAVGIQLHQRVSPSEPSLAETGAGTDHINVTWIPGQYDPDNPTPVGDKFYFKYRVKGTDDWETSHPDGGNFSVMLTNLYPGTVYEVKAVSVVDSEHGGLETESPIYYLATGGRSSGGLAAWLIAVLVAILVLILLVLIIIFVVKCRGAKYPVSAKEKEQGREPMLKDNKGFGEYFPDSVPEDRRSLTGGSKGESESDSMAEYGDGETGRFTEDGSFIGQYGAPNKTFVGPAMDRQNNPNLSTFV